MNFKARRDRQELKQIIFDLSLFYLTIGVAVLMSFSLVRFMA